jgi:hypothetical protein
MNKERLKEIEELNKNIFHAAQLALLSGEAVPELIAALRESQAREAKLREALEFYAQGKHFEWLGDEDFAPENPSGEPSNIECGGDDSNSFTLENGGTARQALAQKEGK